MNHSIEPKLKAAVVTGWTVFLIAYVILLVQWVFYVALVKAKPDWFLVLWGTDATWPLVQSVWLYAMVAYKLLLWAFALPVLWLTLWARRLKKTGV